MIKKCGKCKQIKNINLFGNDKRSTDNKRYCCKQCNNIFQYSLVNGGIPRCYICFPLNTFTSKHETKFQKNDST